MQTAADFPITIFNVMFIDLVDCLRPIIQQRVLNSSHSRAGISKD